MPSIIIEASQLELKPGHFPKRLELQVQLDGHPGPSAATTFVEYTRVHEGGQLQSVKYHAIVEVEVLND